MWKAPPTKPAAASETPPAGPPDPHVDQLKEAGHPVWLMSYMRDLTHTMAPAIKSFNLDAFPRFVGRAFTVNGPDIYLSALEGVPPGTVYVQGGCGCREAVFSPGWTHAYVKPRGGVAVVVDGGVYKSAECNSAATPLYAACASPSIAINRRDGRCNETTVCGGVPVSSGDIVMGDADGVVIIPQACEDEFFAKMATFVRCNGCFGKIAARTVEAGLPLTQEPALADMLERKYASPEAYWREYEPWWAKWSKEPAYAGIEESEVLANNAMMYSK